MHNFLDLSKAFDSILYKNLLKNFNCFGLTGKTYWTFKSYLEGTF